MRDFEFHRPASLDEAKLAFQGADEPKYLGGGQSLIPVMKLDLAAPSDVISLAGIGGLKEIKVEGGNLVIGAGVTHADVAASPAVHQAIGSLATLAGGIGDPQVRNRGTLGGSLAHNDPAADYPAAALALGATIQTDRRSITADDFFQGMFATALEEDEIITAVSFPIPRKSAYAKFPNPASRYAIAGVMVAVTDGGVRVAVTGAGPGVFRANELEQALGANFSAAALDGVTVSSDDLISDADAAADYRAHLVGVMARRAVDSCA